MSKNIWFIWTTCMKTSSCNLLWIPLFLNRVSLMIFTTVKIIYLIYSFGKQSHSSLFAYFVSGLMFLWRESCVFQNGTTSFNVNLCFASQKHEQWEPCLVYLNYSYRYRCVLMTCCNINVFLTRTVYFKHSSWILVHLYSKIHCKYYTYNNHINVKCKK